MNILFNKPFIYLLILAVIAVTTPKIVEAKGVVTAVLTVVAIAVAVVVTVATAGVGALVVAPALGYAVGSVGSIALGVAGGLVGAVVGSFIASVIDPTVTGCWLDHSVSNVYVDKGCTERGGTPIITPSISGFTVNISAADQTCASTDKVDLNIQYSNISQVTKASINRDGQVIASDLTPPPTTYTDRNLPLQSKYVYQVLANLTDGSGAASNVLELGVCVPAIDFKAPSPVELPAPISLFWATENADSLTASGDWSGPKQAGPLPYKTEQLFKPRGNYTFTLTATGPAGTASETRNVRVIQVPRCSFIANPTSIIPPASSTLSWSCQYADSCSIDQGIGSVNNVSGTKGVRPIQTTDYTLTCGGLDDSRSYYATVNVGFTPKLREVIPR